MEQVIGKLMEKLLEQVNRVNGTGRGTLDLSIAEIDILLAALAVYTVDSLIIKKAKKAVNTCRYCRELAEDCTCDRGTREPGQ